MNAPAPDRPVLLSVRAVSKTFGPTRALQDVSVDFLAGEVHALMGENGAGKSTLGKIIAGLYRQDAGDVSIDGRPLAPGSIEEAFGAGVRIVHQELAQCPNLTVAENLCLHDLPRTRWGTVDGREMRRRAAVLLDRLEPGIDPRVPLGSLSPGHRQIVQIAGALDERGGSQGGGARVIVLDEPTSSLSIAETERLLRITRQLASSGITVIYVSHRMGEIFAACDRVTVLRDGRYVATSRVAEIDEGTLVRQMIGREVDMGQKHAPGAGGSSGALLEVGSLSSPGRLREVSLKVAAGEVLGVGGLVGAGRSELLDAIFGIDRRATGRVTVGGRGVARGRPRASMAAGIGYVPEDRRLQGLFFQLGVGENIILPEMPRLARAGVRGAAAERSLVGSRLADFRVKAASRSATPGTLSGGNQQKLLIARWMHGGSKVLLLDEPTRGIDVGTKAEIYRLIRAAAERGAAILLVSSDMPELLHLSDRLIVLADGRMTGELSGGEMTQENVLRLATLDPAAAG